MYIGRLEKKQIYIFELERILCKDVDILDDVFNDLYWIQYNIGEIFIIAEKTNIHESLLKYVGIYYSKHFREYIFPELYTKPNLEGPMWLTLFELRLLSFLANLA